MIPWKSMLAVSVLFLSACGGDGSMIFDGNTFGNLWEKMRPPEDAHVSAVHFHNGGVLDAQHPIVQDGVTVRLSDKTVIKDESCKQCTMNIVILPLTCESAAAGRYECKIRTTRHDSEDPEICTLEGKGIPALAVDCPAF